MGRETFWLTRDSDSETIDIRPQSEKRKRPSDKENSKRDRKNEEWSSQSSNSPYSLSKIGLASMSEKSGI